MAFSPSDKPIITQMNLSQMSISLNKNLQSEMLFNTSGRCVMMWHWYRDLWPRPDVSRFPQTEPASPYRQRSLSISWTSTATVLSVSASKGQFVRFSGNLLIWHQITTLKSYHLKVSLCDQNASRISKNYFVTAKR